MFKRLFGNRPSPIRRGITQEEESGINRVRFDSAKRKIVILSVAVMGIEISLLSHVRASLKLEPARRA
jgi:hypothetical protein